tara:strand:+ start:111 stop:599 length:489 start_codon:yes stop_codon:yes gene_type:complete
MKKNINNKGFTLIELLVVVAIIGILAAVGVVAYSGYTAGAKKQAAKSNQAAVTKYIASEIQKCNLGTDTGKAMKDPNGTERLNCTGKTGGTVVSAAVLALADFKNPHDSKEKAVRSTGNVTGDGDVGYTKISANGNNITIETCFTTKCNVATNRVKNQVTVE